MRFHEDFAEGLRSGGISRNDLSVPLLFEEFVENGREAVEHLKPGAAGSVEIHESASVVNTAAFANITGQIMYSAFMDGYNSEEFVFTKLIPTISTQFNGEKIAGIAGLGNLTESVAEAAQYPTAGVHEDWIETPQTVKRGLIVPVTKEAIFFDRTGMLLDQARKVGESVGIDKENRAIDCVIDENTTAHRHKWRGTSYATYQATTPWVNIKSSNTLVDWVDVDDAEQLFSNMVDPNTGEPIDIMGKDMIVTRQLLRTAQRIVTSTEVRTATPGYATTGNPSETLWRNPVSGYRIISSNRLAARLATDTSWFIGDITKAFRYMQNWPITLAQAPSNNEAEFNRDIVAQYKASERGAYVVMEPRYMVKSTVA
jgi:hypothetical protein